MSIEVATPLTELLRAVPSTLSFDAPTGLYSSQHHPVGPLCHEAADKLTKWEAALRDIADTSTSCEGPGCFWCSQEGEEHPLTLEAKAAMIALTWQHPAGCECQYCVHLLQGVRHGVEGTASEVPGWLEPDQPED